MKVTLIHSGIAKTIVGEGNIREYFANPPYLHLSVEKPPNWVFLDSITGDHLVMDNEAVATFGNEWFAKNRKLPLVEREKFNFFIPCITSNCNMDCSYCYGSAGLCEGKKSEWNMIKEAIDMLAKENSVIELAFFAPGEVTLEPVLLKKTLDYAREKLNIRKTRLSINGVAPWASFKGVIDDKTEIQLSFDGPPDIQNKQRPLKNGAESSELVERNIKKILGDNKKIFVHSVITELHIGREEHTARYFTDLGLKNVSLGNVGFAGKGKEYKKENVKKTFESIMKINELLEMAGVNSYPLIKLLFYKDRREYCAQGFSMQLGSNGTVSSCPHILNVADQNDKKQIDEMIFGEYNFSEKRLELDEKKMEKLRNVHNIAKCDHCEHKLCWGGCPHLNLTETGDMSTPVPLLCESRGIILKLYLGYLAEKEVLKIKPFLSKKNGKSFFSFQYTDFELSDTFANNPFISFDPKSQDMEEIFEQMIKLKNEDKKRMRLLLLSPTCGRLDAKETIKIKEFIYGLKTNHIFFRFSRPLRITDTTEEKENEFYNEFHIPTDCENCLEMFSVEGGRIVFCNGKVGPRLKDVFDRHEIYNHFLKTGSNRVCPSLKI